MKKTIQQRLSVQQRWGFTALLSLLVGSTVYRATQLSYSGQWPELLLCALIVIATPVVILRLWRARLTIKIGKRKLKIKASRLLNERHKLPFAEVADYEFIDLPIHARWSGALIDYGNDRRNYDFGDRQGLFLRMKDGKEFLIFSDQLYQQRESLTDVLAESQAA